MEQDEVFHRAINEAGSKIKHGKNGVDKDGRPAADNAKTQRRAIQSEQVNGGTETLCAHSTYQRPMVPFGMSRLLDVFREWG